MICNSLETYYVAHDIKIKSKYQSYFKNLIGELNVGLILIYSHNEMEKKYLILFSFFTYFSYLHIKTNIYRQKQK